MRWGTSLKWRERKDDNQAWGSNGHFISWLPPSPGKLYFKASATCPWTIICVGWFLPTWHKPIHMGKGETSTENVFHLIGLWACPWGIFLVKHWCGWLHLSGGGATSGLVCLCYVRKQVEQEFGERKPLSSVAPWPRNQFLPSGSCPVWVNPLWSEQTSELKPFLHRSWCFSQQ